MDKQKLYELLQSTVSSNKLYYNN